MKIKTLPKAIVPELLIYISEKGDFTEVCESLSGEYTDSQIRALLREIAVGLQSEVSATDDTDYTAKKCANLSRNSKKIISYLSPHEEKTLLKAFGLIEGK